MPIIKRPAQLAQLKTLIDFVTRNADETGVAEARIKEIELVAEEILVNIFSYAYSDVEGDVTVDCGISGDGLFSIEFRDSGIAFNMLQAQSPDVTAEISEREIGGLGIFLVKKLTSEVEYRREGDENILRVVFGTDNNNG